MFYLIILFKFSSYSEIDNIPPRDRIFLVDGLKKIVVGTVLTENLFINIGFDGEYTVWKEREILLSSSITDIRLNIFNPNEQGGHEGE